MHLHNMSPSKHGRRTITLILSILVSIVSVLGSEDYLNLGGATDYEHDVIYNEAKENIRNSANDITSLPQTGDQSINTANERALLVHYNLDDELYPDLTVNAETYTAEEDGKLNAVEDSLIKSGSQRNPKKRCELCNENIWSGKKAVRTNKKSTLMMCSGCYKKKKKEDILLFKKMSKETLEFIIWKS
eukprot:68636_1